MTWKGSVQDMWEYKKREETVMIRCSEEKAVSQKNSKVLPLWKHLRHFHLFLTLTWLFILGKKRKIKESVS